MHEGTSCHGSKLCFLSTRWETGTALPDKRLAVPPVIKLNWLGLHALWQGCPGGRDALRPPSPRLRPTAVPACSVHCQSCPAPATPCTAAWLPCPAPSPGGCSALLHCCVAALSCPVSWRVLSPPALLRGFLVLHHLLEVAQPSCTAAWLPGPAPSPGGCSALLYRL